MCFPSDHNPIPKWICLRMNPEQKLPKKDLTVQIIESECHSDDSVDKWIRGFARFKARRKQVFYHRDYTNTHKTMFKLEVNAFHNSYVKQQINAFYFVHISLQGGSQLSTLCRFLLRGLAFTN